MASREQPESAEETQVVPVGAGLGEFVGTATNSDQLEESVELSGDGSAGPSRRAGPSQREFDRGDEIGRYVILERVGAGGMGVVYAAWDPKLDRKVALKLLHDPPGDRRDPRARRDRGQRLEREAQAMARLTHPNVIAVHDVGEVDGRVFVAMEFVEGETLGVWAGIDKAAPRAEPRSWTEILDVLLAAGQGLAAAHAEGLIHRDFKPDNVMIGADQRVRVMDFGLVRAATPSAGPSPGSNLVETSEQARRTGPRGTLIDTTGLATESSSLLDSELTLAGSLLGTPAYMAPEQLRGDESDARADQFSFCVAVWQCLYGVRPFGGDSPLAVLFAISEGKFREPPPGRAVPTWVRRALERGLAPDPDARWPDMPALLAALANDPKSKRRPWLLGGGSLLVAIAAATAAILLEKPPPPAPCERVGDELNALWSEPRRAELAAAFARSELVYANETAGRVDARLDDWAQGWIGARTAACEDTEVRHEQSPELLDLRMACLDQRRDRFAALVELLVVADDTVIEKAVEAVDALPSFAICGDRSWLTATVRPPEQPELAEAVAELREGLAKVSAMIDAGKAAEAITLAKRFDANAAKLAWTPAIAEAALQLGRVHQERGEFAEARVALERGYFAARRSGHDEVTAQAGTLLIYGLSVGLGELDQAAVWIDHVLPEAERIGRDDLLAEVHAAIGIYYYGKSDDARAAAAFARSLELHAAGSSVSLGAARINYGTLLARTDPSKRAEAFAELALGLELLERSLGAQHPNFAVALSNLATVHGQFGEHRQAIALLERALAIDELVLGPKHPMTGLVLLNLATNLVELVEVSTHGVEVDQAELERGSSYAERSLAIHREVLGEQHVMVAQSEQVVALALIRLGRPRDASSHAEAAEAIWIATFGEDHVDTASSRLILAICDAALGNSVEARARLEAILAGPHDDRKLRATASLELATLIVGEDPERAASLLTSAQPHFDAVGDLRNNQRVAALQRQLSN